MRNFLAALLFATACGSAYADQVVSPGTMIAIDVAPTKIRAPYDVQVIREDGETLPTYAAKDRFYVEGLAGQRYTIRISNPTGHRVEAVVSVDGLDAVDGEAGDLHKRGYIVPAYGTKKAAPPPAEYAPTTTSGGGARPSPEPRRHYEEHIDADDDRGGDAEIQAHSAAPPTYRPGLGTEFGESRSSAANYTRFTRSTTRPIAIAELRYNDAAGLMALGIAIQAPPDENEIMTRETADPFPGDRFAHPAR